MGIFYEPITKIGGLFGLKTLTFWRSPSVRLWKLGLDSEDYMSKAQRNRVLF